MDLPLLNSDNNNNNINSTNLLLFLRNVRNENCVIGVYSMKYGVWSMLLYKNGHSTKAANIVQEKVQSCFFILFLNQAKKHGTIS